MNPLTERSTRILELDKILALAAAEATSMPAKDRILAITPTDCYEDAETMLGRTSDAFRLSGIAGKPPFSGIREVNYQLDRAVKGGSMNPKELLDIAALLRSARQTHTYRRSDRIARDDFMTSLDYLFDGLTPIRSLEERIEAAIISEEEISDNASPELRNIRRQISVVNQRIREHLQRIISSQSTAKLLQDPIITQRSGRFVVPVKSELRNELPGIVHDTSGSGATVFIEPAAVVEGNNQLRILDAAERQEIERILAELSALCADEHEAIRLDFNLLVELDVHFAKAGFSGRYRCAPPILNREGRIRLRAARHPLLDRDKAVPIDIALGTDYDALVITGPNTGGKTVALKTLGLLALMVRCGLHIPCGFESEMAVFPEIYADIGDEQSIEQSLSTFSSHMVNIVGILGKAAPGSLILLDELGAGTDPAEGAALAVSIIESILKLGAKTAATTHYAELKAFALNTDRVENATCEFDVETMRPTYRLITGIPGRSNAFAICRRLGLSEDILEHADGLMRSENKRFEEVIATLERARQSMEKDRAEAERQLFEARQSAKDAKEASGRLETEREKLREEARMKARAIVAEARASVNNVYAELELIKAEKTSYDNLGEARAVLNRTLNRASDSLVATEREAAKEEGAPVGFVKRGDIVELADMGVRAAVLTLPDRDGALTVQAGILKVSTNISNLRVARELTKKKKGGAPAGSTATEPVLREVVTELDLRGMASDEALLELERFLDSAVMLKLPSVRVIHGKGTGVLRAAVTKRLRSMRDIKSFRLGTFGEGEDGVTVVEL